LHWQQAGQLLTIAKVAVLFLGGQEHALAVLLLELLGSVKTSSPLTSSVGRLIQMQSEASSNIFGPVIPLIAYIGEPVSGQFKYFPSPVPAAAFS
jgi:hypothetical protein